MQNKFLGKYLGESGTSAGHTNKYLALGLYAIAGTTGVTNYTHNNKYSQYQTMFLLRIRQQYIYMKCTHTHTRGSCEAYDPSVSQGNFTTQDKRPHFATIFLWFALPLPGDWSLLSQECHQSDIWASLTLIYTLLYIHSNKLCTIEKESVVVCQRWMPLTLLFIRIHIHARLCKVSFILLSIKKSIHTFNFDYYSFEVKKDIEILQA